MDTKQQTPASNAVTAKPHPHHAQKASRAFTGRKVRCTFDFQKRITREAPNTIQISCLSSQKSQKQKK
jgi:hypothetical protein